MTAARHLTLVASNPDATVIALPVRIEHNALRHAVLREARDGLILRDEQRTTIAGRAVLKATRDAIDALVNAGCIAWTGGNLTTGKAAGITRSGRRQLAAWDTPRLPGGDVA